MKIQEKMRKPVLEAKYLNVENTDRYRPIIRLFYLKYEKLKYWLYQEEVFEELKEDPYFADYTMEQCQQDLTCIFRKNCASVPEERSAIPLQTEQSSAG